MTRMLVPPLHERQGTLRGCIGVTMEDGTVYRANRAGHMEVHRPDHVAAMLRDPTIAGDIVQSKFTSPKGATELTCPHCDFVCWSWQSECPRCGTALNKIPEGV